MANPINLTLTKEEISFIDKYITALRSRSYNQTFGILGCGTRIQEGLTIESDCFCALGVAADLKIKERPNEWQWVPDGWNIYSLEPLVDVVIEPDTQLDAFLPAVLFNETGLNKLGITQDTIQHWNDVDGASFAAIAAKIERVLNKYYEDQPF